jgi:hypothetical protein
MSIDQGVLQMLNKKHPGCGDINNRYAEFFANAGTLVSVPKGTPCPSSHNLEWEYLSSDVSRACVNSNFQTNKPPDQLEKDLNECLNPSPPAAPTPHRDKMNMWVFWAILAAILTVAITVYLSTK